jgi:hypothetical protein
MTFSEDFDDFEAVTSFSLKGSYQPIAENSHSIGLL